MIFTHYALSLQHDAKSCDALLFKLAKAGVCSIGEMASMDVGKMMDSGHFCRACPLGDRLTLLKLHEAAFDEIYSRACDWQSDSAVSEAAFAPLPAPGLVRNRSRISRLHRLEKNGVVDSCVNWRHGADLPVVVVSLASASSEPTLAQSSLRRVCSLGGRASVQTMGETNDGSDAGTSRLTHTSLQRLNPVWPLLLPPPRVACFTMGGNRICYAGPHTDPLEDATVPGSMQVDTLLGIQDWFLCTGQPMTNPANWTPLGWQPAALIHNDGTLGENTDGVSSMGRIVTLLPTRPTRPTPVGALGVGAGTPMPDLDRVHTPPTPPMRD